MAQSLNSREGGFDTALILGRVNQYYLTGTMQDGVFVLRSDGSAHFFVRKSFERARAESPLDCLVRMGSYRDMLSLLPADLGITYMDTEVVPVAMLERIRKYFSSSRLLSVDRILVEQRAVKDAQEIALIEESGRQHAQLLNQTLPALLREGMSEAELTGAVYQAMVQAGHHGLSRFSMFQMDMVVGQLGFGENSLYPTNFDGPGGMKGLHPASPSLGSRERLLKRGDLVFADIGYGYLGYHSDKTQVYSFVAPPSDAAVERHEACRAVLAKALSRMQPGQSAAEAYDYAMADIPPCLSKHFMGYGNERVKFLGHGVGLHIDEAPVIISGNETILRPGMVVALEPKCGVEGQGMVGVEETYLITETGPRCLTGGDREIILV